MSDLLVVPGMCAGESSRDMLSVFERFFAFEDKKGLFSREVCGVRFWHCMRFSLYSGIILPRLVPMGEAHPDSAARPQVKEKKKAGGSPFTAAASTRPTGAMWRLPAAYRRR